MHRPRVLTIAMADFNPPAYVEATNFNSKTSVGPQVRTGHDPPTDPAQPHTGPQFYVAPVPQPYTGPQTGIAPQPYFNPQPFVSPPAYGAPQACPGSALPLSG